MADNFFGNKKANFPAIPRKGENKMKFLQTQEGQNRQNDTSKFLRQFRLTKIKDADGQELVVLAIPGGIGSTGLTSCPNWEVTREGNGFKVGYGYFMIDADNELDVSPYVPEKIVGGNSRWISLKIHLDNGNISEIEIVGGSSQPENNCDSETGSGEWYIPIAHIVDDVIHQLLCLPQAGRLCSDCVVTSYSRR